VTGRSAVAPEDTTLGFYRAAARHAGYFPLPQEYAVAIFTGLVAEPWLILNPGGSSFLLGLDALAERGFPGESRDRTALRHVQTVSGAGMIGLRTSQFRRKKREQELGSDKKKMKVLAVTTRM